MGPCSPLFTSPHVHCPPPGPCTAARELRWLTSHFGNITNHGHSLSGSIWTDHAYLSSSVPSGSWWTPSQPQQLTPPLGPLELLFCLLGCSSTRAVIGSTFHFIQVGVQIPSAQNMSLPPVYSSTHSCGYCDKCPQTWSLKTTHIESLAVPEVRHRSQFHWARTKVSAGPLSLWRLPRRRLFSSLSSRTPWVPWRPSPSSENLFCLCCGQISRCLPRTRPLHPGPAQIDHPGQL